MAIETKLIGTTITLNATFKNELSKTVTPATVNLVYKKSDGTIVDLPVEVGTNSVYTADVLLDVAGTWFFRWESVGSNSIAKEFTVIVKDTNVQYP